jgi:hypothetical protein
MKKAFIFVAVIALLVMLVPGCNLGEGQAPAPPAPEQGESTPTPEQGASTPAGGEVNFRLFVSDEQNAILDFNHLWVYVTDAAVQQGGESGSWEPLKDFKDVEIDLRPLVDTNAYEIWSGYLDPGVYSKVFIHIDGIRSDPEEEIKLPSEKLQISSLFEIKDDGTIEDFVYDITVHKAGQSGMYILQPQIQYSGTDQPINDVTPEGDLEIITTHLPNGGVGEEYEAELEAIGGMGDYEWTLSAGDLPEGLELSSNGVISGTPDADLEEDYTDYTFTVQVEDEAEETDTQAFTITIASEGVLIITTTSLPDGVVGEEYEAKLEAIGGTGEYTWTLSAGDLPEGLVLSSDGEISGTPTTEESQTFTVQVEDEAAETDTQELTITIGTD